MKIKATLQISHDRKSGCFYIPVIYESKITIFKNKQLILTCNDFKPVIRFVVKLQIHTFNNYKQFRIHIPKRLISQIIKYSIKEHYNLSLIIL